MRNKKIGFVFRKDAVKGKRIHGEGMMGALIPYDEARGVKGVVRWGGISFMIYVIYLRCVGQ